MLKSKATTLLGGILLSTSMNASAILIDFEDAGALNNLTVGYKGLTWDSNVGDMYVINGTDPLWAGTGYEVMANAVPGSIVAYNGFASKPVDIAVNGSGAFDLNSAWFTSIYAPVFTMQFSGLLNGIEIYNLQFDALNTVALMVNFNWTNIDTLRITSNSNHFFAMDNLSINLVSSVAEPAPLALLGLGLIGMGYRFRKTNRAL